MARRSPQTRAALICWIIAGLAATAAVLTTVWVRVGASFGIVTSSLDEGGPHWPIWVVFVGVGIAIAATFGGVLLTALSASARNPHR